MGRSRRERRGVEEGYETVSVTWEDVERLRSAATSDVRRYVAAEIGADYAAGALSPRARADALAIFRRLLEDVEATVRGAMAETLCRTIELPRDIAQALARDVIEVATPMLEESEVLDEQDLIDIVHRPVSDELRERLAGTDEDQIDGDTEARRLAIARRRKVPSRLATALVENGTPAVVTTLLGNHGARLVEAVVHRIIDRFGHHRKIQTALVDRSTLPVTVVERMLFLVSEKLRDRLIQSHNVSPMILSGMVNQVREAATLDLLKGDMSGRRSARLAQGLARQDRLGPTILLRSLCLGEFAFFETALAQRSGLGVEMVRNRLRNGSEFDASQIYRQASLPDSLKATFLHAIAEAYRVLAARTTGTRETFCRHMVRSLSIFIADKDGAPNDIDLNQRDLDYLLSLLGKGFAPPIDIVDEAAARVT